MVPVQPASVAARTMARELSFIGWPPPRRVAPPPVPTPPRNRFHVDATSTVAPGPHKIGEKFGMLAHSMTRHGPGGPQHHGGSGGSLTDLSTATGGLSFSGRR